MHNCMIIKKNKKFELRKIFLTQKSFFSCVFSHKCPFLIVIRFVLKFCASMFFDVDYESFLNKKILSQKPMINETKQKLKIAKIAFIFKNVKLFEISIKFKID